MTFMMKANAKWGWAGIVGCVLAAGLAVPACAQVVVKKTTSYFVIQGKTARDLDAALAHSGPQIENTSHHPGAAQIRYTGGLTYKEIGGLCAITKARVDLSLNIVLPKWANRQGAPTNLAFLWDTLASDIKRHEEHHAAIAIAHAHQMEKALEALKPERDCRSLQAKASTVTDEQIALQDADQLKFDRNEAATFETRMARLLKNRAQVAANN